MSMKTFFFTSIKMVLLFTVICFLYSCSNDEDKNRLKSDAVIEWRGEYEVDGCGFFILIGDKEYKPVNEDVIDDSFKSVNTNSGNVANSRNVVIEYELLDEKVESACGDSQSPIVCDGIKIISIKR